VLVGNNDGCCKVFVETYRGKIKSQWSMWQTVTWTSKVCNILLLQKKCVSKIIYS